MLKVVRNSVIVILAACACACASAGAQRWRQRYIFPPIIDELIGRTHVPIRLPDYLPFNSDASNPLYATVQDADEQGYRVEVGWDPDCVSHNPCHFVTLYGSRKPIVLADRKRESVALAKGLKGEFGATVCAAVCSDAEVAWVQDGIYYVVAMKAGKLDEVLQVVNSEIETEAIVSGAK